MFPALTSAACIPAKDYEGDNCPESSDLWRYDCCPACAIGEICTLVGDPLPEAAPLLECPEKAPVPQGSCVLHSTLSGLSCNYDKYCVMPEQQVVDRRRATVTEDFTGCIWIMNASCDGTSWAVAMASVGQGYESCSTVCGRRTLLFGAPKIADDTCGCSRARALGAF